MAFASGMGAVASAVLALCSAGDHIVAGDALSAADTNDLLQAYLGRPASAGELRRVARYGCAYRYLELLWYLVQQHLGFDGVALRQKLDLLERQLGEISP